MDTYFVLKKLLEEQEKIISTGTFNRDVFNTIQREADYLFMKLPLAGMEDIKLLYCKVITDAVNGKLISEQEFSRLYKSIVKHYETILSLRSQASEVSSCIEHLYAYGKLSESNAFADVNLRSFRRLLQLPDKLNAYINSLGFRDEILAYLTALYECYSNADGTESEAFLSKAFEALVFIVELGIITDDESDRIKSSFVSLDKMSFCAILQSIIKSTHLVGETSNFGG